MWSTSDGAIYKTSSGDSLRYFEKRIQQMFLSPLPTPSSLDSDRIKLDLKMLPAKNPMFTCVFETMGWMVKGKVQFPSTAMPNGYCFDPSTLALRIVYSNEFVQSYNQLVKTQGHYVARQVDVRYGGLPVFSVSVESMNGINATDPAFTPPANATLERGALTSPNDQRNDVAVGHLKKKIAPTYPASSKMNYEQGKVVLAGTIGKDGTVHDLEVLAAPSNNLAQAAMDAVKKWQYTPYLLNGNPVEVETTINVIFSLGGSHVAN